MTSGISRRFLSPMSSTLQMIASSSRVAAFQISRRNHRDREAALANAAFHLLQEAGVGGEIPLVDRHPVAVGFERRDQIGRERLVDAARGDSS